MKEARLPQTKKEGLLYGGIICLITVIIMLIANIGLSFQNALTILTLIPMIWCIAILLEALIIGKISDLLVKKFTVSSDGFNTKILFNILFCVTGMSLCMTIIGGMLESGGLSIEPIINLPTHWPRNFFIAFWCEILLAQPIARLVMKSIHKHAKDTITNSEAEVTM